MGNCSKNEICILFPLTSTFVEMLINFWFCFVFQSNFVDSLSEKFKRHLLHGLFIQGYLKGFWWQGRKPYKVTMVVVEVVITSKNYRTHTNYIYRERAILLSTPKVFSIEWNFELFLLCTYKKKEDKLRRLASESDENQSWSWRDPIEKMKMRELL